MREWLTVISEGVVVVIDAMALIRTFAEIVLERDLAELRERQREPAGV